MKRAPIPSFRKGQLVRPAYFANAWRRLTSDEREAWYKEFHTACREGKDTWHDDAGEPRLAPSDMSFTLTPEMTLTVVRARVSAPAGYGKVTGCAQVFCPDNGETLYVQRKRLTDKW